MTRTRITVCLFFSGALLSFPANAAENEFTLTIKDHRFEPSTLAVPAGKQISLTVINSDPTSEEFESDDLHVEKMIRAGKQATFGIGPLAAGSYSFIGEHHRDTANGAIVAK